MQFLDKRFWLQMNLAVFGDFLQELFLTFPKNGF